MPEELQCARDLKKVLYIPQLLCNFWYALINPFLPSPNLHLIGQPSACSLCIWLFCLFLHFVLLIPHIGIFWCGLRPTVSMVFWMQWTNSHGLLKSCGEKGWHGHSLSERVPQALPGQAFIAFLGALHQGRSSFIMHRFALGDYLLQITKKRMLQIQGKKLLN